MTAFLQEANGNESLIFWEELTQHRDYSRQRVAEWKKKYRKVPEIADIIKKIEDLFRVRLIKVGMNSKNPAMAIFVLKNFYNMTDKVVTESEIVHKVLRASVEIVPANNLIATDESKILL